MKSFISLVLLLSIFSSSLWLGAQAIVQEREHDQYLPDYSHQRAKAAQSMLHYFHSLFWTKYAPIKWKQKRYQWNPDTEFESCISQIEQVQTWTLDTLKPIFSRFVYSCQDVHTAVIYDDPRMAYIPLEIDYVDGHLFVIESSVPGISKGDEILMMNGQPPIDHIKKVFYGCEHVLEARPHFLLDHAFHRMGRFLPVPKVGEKLALEVMHKDSIKKINLSWYISKAHNYLNSHSNKHLSSFPQNLAKNKKRPSSLNPHLSRKDMPARLAHLTSEQKRFLAQAYKSEFYAQSCDQGGFQTARLDWEVIKEAGIDVGYLKIEDFSQIDFEQVDMALKLMEKKTQCLVIDLRGNPGGYDLSMYALAMRMTSKPLVNLMYSCMLDEGVIEAHRSWLCEYDDILDLAHCDEDVAGWTDEYGLPCTLELLKSLRSESITCIEEWENGYTCTRFSPMRGIKVLVPHPQVRYTKPLYILIDERCASCADLFPAIMKDNDRAILLGRTTSGAGGTVEHFPVTNAFGIEEIDLTTSLVLRNTLQVIEDNGVSPDFEHKKTVQSAINPREEKMQAVRFAAEKCK